MCGKIRWLLAAATIYRFMANIPEQGIPRKMEFCCGQFSFLTISEGVLPCLPFCLEPVHVTDHVIFRQPCDNHDSKWHAWWWAFLENSGIRFSLLHCVVFPLEREGELQEANQYTAGIILVDSVFGWEKQTLKTLLVTIAILMPVR